jgi:hypothetical protein
LDTIFDVTTTMSPSASGVSAATAAAAMVVARSAPSTISAMPATPKICTPVTG